MLVEICAGSLKDCINAYNGGAKRVELNAALYLGGLTPSIATLRLVKEKTDLKVISMVRPRAAGFIYNSYELEEIFESAKELLDNGSDGLAFGFLNKDLTIDVKNTEKMVRLIHSYNKEAVFHKAFDITKNIFESIETLINLNVDRVLTSGGNKNVELGKENLKKLQDKYGNKIEILAGGGVRNKSIKSIIEYTGISQIHSSCKDFEEDISTSNDNLSYSYLEGENINKYDIVSEMKVKDLINLVDKN